MNRFLVMRHELGLTDKAHIYSPSTHFLFLFSWVKSIFRRVAPEFTVQRFPTAEFPGDEIAALVTGEQAGRSAETVQQAFRRDRHHPGGIPGEIVTETGRQEFDVLRGERLADGLHGRGRDDHRQ